MKKSLGTGGSLINLKVKSGRTNLQLGKLICISKLYFSTLFSNAFPNCVSHPAGHKLGKLGNKMGSSLKLGSRDLGALSEEPKEDFQVNRSTSSSLVLNNWF